MGDRIGPDNRCPEAEVGGSEVAEAQELKQLRDENTRLKKLVADADAVEIRTRFVMSERPFRALTLMQPTSSLYARLHENLAAKRIRPTKTVFSEPYNSSVYAALIEYC